MNETMFIPGGLVTILLASAVTYTLRLGGLLLAGMLPTSGPARRFLDALPGAILISLVVPAALQAGTTGIIGIAACLLAFVATRNLPATMAAGILTVWFLRQGLLF